MDHPANKRQKGPDGSPVSAPSATASRHSTTIRRASPSPSANKPSIRLTVKSAPSKLRQAVGTDDLPPNPYAEHDDTETPEPPVRNARSTRNPRTVVEPDSDDDAEDAQGEDDMEEDDEDEDAEGDVDADILANEDSEDDGDEDEDADGDLDMEEAHPPPPIIKSIPKTPTQSSGNKKRKIDVTVTAPPAEALKSVEEKEDDDDDDGELSDLPSDEEDEEEVDGSDEEDDESSSRMGTPDLSKLTRRQRATYDEGLDTQLMALSNEALKKKHLTAEEHAMRRTEMARRRKNLSEKRNEEEKMDTINKLLKKPAPKRRTRAEMIAAAAAGTLGEDGEEEPAYPLYVRWVNNSSGSSIGVPTEWLEAPVGEQLKPGWKGPPVRKLIEEVA